MNCEKMLESITSARWMRIHAATRSSVVTAFRRRVLSFLPHWINVVINMEEEPPQDDGQVDRIAALNTIFEDLISDASDLVKDLYWGVKTYLFFGLISLLFGVQTIIYNIDTIQARLYIPVVVGGAMIFSGLVQIGNYFRLRLKYSKLFSAQDELRKA